MMSDNTEGKWFKKWFDTPYYHVLYSNRNDEEAKLFVDNLVNYLDLNDTDYCLDLACGKGRHAVNLNNHGLRVLGLDLSENSIKAAKEFENESLKFDVHDMRGVYQSEQFDAIFNLFTSFGYFDDESENIKVLKAIHQMMKPDAKLVIDFFNADKVINSLVETEVKSVQGLTFNIKRWYDGKHIFKNIQFFADGENHDYTERVQALKIEDFERMLNQTGFKLVNKFGDFNLGDFNKSTSGRLILVAKPIFQ